MYVIMILIIMYCFCCLGGAGGGAGGGGAGGWRHGCHRSESWGLLVGFSAPEIRKISFFKHHDPVIIPS